jgi:hypothetical protein
MLSRRSVIAGLAALSTVSLAACRRRMQVPEPDTVPEEGPPQNPPRPAQPAAAPAKPEAD